jgi:hypothetical protein
VQSGQIGLKGIRLVQVRENLTYTHLPYASASEFCMFSFLICTCTDVQLVLTPTSPGLRCQSRHPRLMPMCAFVHGAVNIVAR